jgi:hypothetical protein
MIPIDIFNMLTIQGLAHLISSDGSYASGGGMYLNVQCFTVIDVVRLMNVLIIKFDCVCTIHYQRGLPTIYISAASMRKITPLLVPHMVPSMMYKLTGS